MYLMNGDEITVPTHNLPSVRDLRAVLERGENAKGQLGDGTTTQQKRPVKAPCGEGGRRRLWFLPQPRRPGERGVLLQPLPPSTNGSSHRQGRNR